jgi:membrane associated rhomboid family serine protease
MQTCYRHKDRETRVSCSSCGRPICTDCMIATPVGFRCPECAKQKTKVKTAAQIYDAEPRVTYVLIAINVLAFAAQVMFGSGGGAQARSGPIYEQGVLFGPFIAELNEYWRLITSGFLHSDPYHLLLNMVGLWFLGQMVERAVGPVKYVALYVASLLAGSAGALLLEANGAAVGASGAVFGLLGAAFLLAGARGNEPMRRIIGVLLLLSLLMSFRPGISLGAHVGGLLGGLAAAWLITQADDRRMPVLAVAGCVAVALVAIAAAIAAANGASVY